MKRAETHETRALELWLEGMDEMAGGVLVR
jgi:hypothetical protein